MAHASSAGAASLTFEVAITSVAPLWFTDPPQKSLANLAQCFCGRSWWVLGGARTELDPFPWTLDVMMMTLKEVRPTVVRGLALQA